MTVPEAGLGKGIVTGRTKATKVVCVRVLCYSRLCCVHSAGRQEGQ
jgi:hypothetical protein